MRSPKSKRPTGLLRKIRDSRVAYQLLEPRCLLAAGDVTAMADAGVAVIVGDELGNCIEITQESGTEVRVTGVDGTTVNGGAFAVIEASALNVMLGDGSDQAVVNTVNLSGDVVIDMGSGDPNRTEVNNSMIGGNVDISNGDSLSNSTTDNVIGHFNQVLGNSITGNVRITNGNSVSSTTAGDARGHQNFLDSNTSIGGDVTIINGNSDSDSITTTVGAFTEGHRNEFRGRHANIGGSISVTNGIGDNNSQSTESFAQSFGHRTEVQFVLTIGGSVTVENGETISSSTSATSFAQVFGPNVEFQFIRTIGGDVTATFGNNMSQSNGTDFAQVFGDRAEFNGNQAETGGDGVLNGNLEFVLGDLRATANSSMGFAAIFGHAAVLDTINLNATQTITGNVDFIIGNFIGQSVTESADSFASSEGHLVLVRNSAGGPRTSAIVVDGNFTITRGSSNSETTSVGGESNADGHVLRFTTDTGGPTPPTSTTMIGGDLRIVDGDSTATSNSQTGDATSAGPTYLGTESSNANAMQTITGSTSIMTGPSVLSATSTGTTTINPTSVTISGGTFGGDMSVNLNEGPNTAQFSGEFNGNSFTYRGGNDTDIVTYDFTGNPTDLNVVLRAGDDSFTLGPNSVIAPTTLRVDFGGGGDTFINNLGAFTFNANLLNWHGFSRFYTVTDNSLNIVQVADTADITLDNNGTGGAFRIIDGFVTEMTPADNVRLNMLSGSATNVNVDLDAALAGDILLDLLGGDRTVRFTGSDNSIGGDLRVFGGNDSQRVDLAVNNALSVAGNAVTVLRAGNDQVDENGNNVSVGNDLSMRGVNSFENNGTLMVANVFRWNTAAESVNSRLDNDATMNIGSRLNYMGGDGIDEVLLNDGVTVGGPTFIDLGAGSGGSIQNISLIGGFNTTGRLTIRGGQNAVGNFVATDAATMVGGDFTVDFSSSTATNQAVLAGTYGGNFGLYRGGTGQDMVSLGAMASDMQFRVNLNDGDDTFTLNVGTNLLSLRVDFGNGTDTFNDNIGAPYPFPVTILNLP